MDHGSVFLRKGQDLIRLKPMAQESAAYGPADHHGYNGVSAFPRLRQSQLVCPCGLVHPEDFLHLAGAVSRSVYDQENGPFFLCGFSSVRFHGCVDGKGHLIGFLHSDYTKVHHGEPGVDCLGVIGQDGGGFSVNFSCSYHRSRAELRIKLRVSRQVFHPGVLVIDHRNGFPSFSD